MNTKYNAFNPQLPVDIYYRNLPHWRQPGSTYFVTFRLADSIPGPVVARWNNERKAWLEANGVSATMAPAQRTEAYSKINPDSRKNFERDQARRLFKELNQCHGCCILKDPGCRAVLQESMLHFDEERYSAGDFVIMPNHVHWIVQPIEPHPLETILQSIKRFVSTRLNKLNLHEGGRLWQGESHDHIIRNQNELARIREYIRTNPLKAQLPDDQYAIYSADWLDD